MSGLNAAGIVAINVPNAHERKYSGLSQGDAAAVLIDIDKYNDMVKEDRINFKIINCGKIPHDNDKLLKLFKRCKKIFSFNKIEPSLILQDGPLDDLFYLKVTDFINQEGVNRGDLPVGIGPGGEYLTPGIASNKTFQAMLIGFEIVNNEIQIGGGLKTDDVIHGNTVFQPYMQKSIVDQFVKNFGTRFTYYITVYQPEKKGFFS